MPVGMIVAVVYGSHLVVAAVIGGLAFAIVR